jgi:CubicO group peptidase (beta-lactamase class C family)
VHKPGKVVAYSNWGSALAAYIVERVSGQSFDEYVHEHIFAPLGMEHTALNATLSDNEWVAKKHAEQKYYTIEWE